MFFHPPSHVFHTVRIPLKKSPPEKCWLPTLGRVDKTQSFWTHAIMIGGFKPWWTTGRIKVVECLNVGKQTLRYISPVYSTLYVQTWKSPHEIREMFRFSRLWPEAYCTKSKCSNYASYHATVSKAQYQMIGARMLHTWPRNWNRTVRHWRRQQILSWRIIIILLEFDCIFHNNKQIKIEHRPVCYTKTNTGCFDGYFVHVISCTTHKIVVINPHPH